MTRWDAFTLEELVALHEGGGPMAFRAEIVAARQSRCPHSGGAPEVVQWSGAAFCTVCDARLTAEDLRRLAEASPVSELDAGDISPRPGDE